MEKGLIRQAKLSLCVCEKIGSTTQNITDNVCCNKDSCKNDKDSDQLVKEACPAVAKNLFGKFVLPKPFKHFFRSCHNKIADNHDDNAKNDAKNRIHRKRF